MWEYYGDLNDPRGVKFCSHSAVFVLKPIFIALRRWIKPILCSDHDDKTVILMVSIKTAHYRFFPVKNSLNGEPRLTVIMRR